MTDEKLDEWYAAEEAKSYNPRQPRDDHGRWDDGAGGISQGHAAHVMKLEGISDAAAAGVLGKIKSGEHKTREDVLKHIDAIHAAGAGAASSTHSGDAQSNYSRFPKKLPAGMSATATAAALGVPDDFYVRPKGHSTRNGIDYGLSGSDTLHDVNPKYATHELDAALEDYGKKQQKVLGRSVHTMEERNAADDRVGKEMEAILNKARAAQSNGVAAAGGKEEPTLHNRILSHLAEKGGRNGGEIARDLGADHKEVLSALGDLRAQGHTEKNRFNRDEITPQGKVSVAGSSAPSSLSIQTGKATMIGGFDAPLQARSGGRTYSKNMAVGAVELRTWEPPDGGEPRVYINGAVEGGTSAQRGGGYDLGHLRYEGKELQVHGGKDVEGAAHGVPEDHQARIHAVAKQMLDHLRQSRKSADDIEYSNDETEAIMDNTLINFGGEIKSVEETETGYKFGGWLVVFDKPDVSGLRDRFTKSTDFDIEDGDRRSLYYNHGLDGTIKKEKLGDCHVSIKDAGVWISGELKKRSDYLAKHVQHIAENIKQFGLSSGAPAHLVERVKVDGGHEIKKWVLSEASITPTPAEPMTFCTSLKSLVEMEGDGDLLDEAKSWDESQHHRADDGKFGSGGSANNHDGYKEHRVEAHGKVAFIREEPHPLKRGGKVYRAYEANGTPLYEGSEDLGALKEQVSQALKPKAVASVADHVQRANEELRKLKGEGHTHLEAARILAKKYPHVQESLARLERKSLEEGDGDLFDGEMKGDDFEDARFSIGDEVQPTVNHMPGMTKMVGKVVIVRDGNPPYYGIKFEGMEGIHKWYAEDELKAASDDDQTSSDREETSGKSNDETKHLDTLSDGQREGSRFNDHSSRLLEANEEFMERVQSFMQSRAANRKSGRVLSADKHAQISEYRDGLQTIVESLSALLDEHDPNAESKSLDNEIEELEIGWMQQQLKLNDLLRKV